MTEHIDAEIYGWLLVSKGGPGSGRRSNGETTVEGRLIALQRDAANMAQAGANKQVLSPARLTRIAINHGKEAELLAASQGPGHEKYEALHRKASDAITAAATAASRGDADVHKKIADAAAASFAAISADKGGAITDGQAYYCIQGDATPMWLSPNPVAKGGAGSGRHAEAIGHLRTLQQTAAEGQGRGVRRSTDALGRSYTRASVPYGTTVGGHTSYMNWRIESEAKNLADKIDQDRSKSVEEHLDDARNKVASLRQEAHQNSLFDNYDTAMGLREQAGALQGVIDHVSSKMGAGVTKGGPGSGPRKSFGDRINTRSALADVTADDYRERWQQAPMTDNAAKIMESVARYSDANPTASMNGGWSTPEQQEAIINEHTDAIPNWLVQSATPADLDALTDNNYHSAVEAIIRQRPELN